jgi:polysaccharide biosynthesis transport protein
MRTTDLLFYGTLLLRRLPLILLVTCLAAIAGVLIAQSQTPVYRATATVLVESPEIPDDLARSTVMENAVVQVQIIQQQLLTDNSLMALAEQFAVFSPELEMTQSEIATEMRERIQVEQAQLGNTDWSANAFKISFSANTSQLAADVANFLASTILMRGSERRTERATQTLAFFEQDVTVLTNQLADLDKELLRFKSEHLNDLPDSLEFRRTRQSTYEERLLLLEREAATLRNRRANLVLLYEVTGRDVVGGVPTPQGQLLAELQRALLTQSTIYGPTSYPVEALNKRIAELKPETVSVPGEEAGTDQPSSELELQLADIDDQLSALAQERDSIRVSLESLATSIGATPQNESTLAVLERNRENTQVLYKLALERLAEATTGAEIEARLKGERLSLVEAATPPQHPQPTKKRLIAGAAVGGGIALALGLILAFEFLNRRVRRPVELERELDIQTMVTIPYLPSSWEIWRRRLLVTGSVLLIGAGLVPLSSSSLGMALSSAMAGMGVQR